MVSRTERWMNLVESGCVLFFPQGESVKGLAGVAMLFRLISHSKTMLSRRPELELVQD